MSLDFNFREMIDRVGQKEYDRITDHPTEKGKWHPVTDAIIWNMLAIGIGRITADNVDKVWERTCMVQGSNGSTLGNKDGAIYLTRADIENHVGLRTNISFERDATFYAKVARMARAVGERKARLQDKSAFDVCAERATADTDA